MRGLTRDSYADFGPALEAETLRERHSIEISKACVRRIMIDAGGMSEILCLGHNMSLTSMYATQNQDQPGC
ncbi:hypothetical protein [Cupriavidus malaysiensis]|uniref:Integrase n=1 Tax=Cupriavidus malaysiensis TaxID=367825 RepID=A0A1D9I990_9BURK|nr:hypothetical protein [Cupriavidus malaysiensis]AOZ08651.1 hypothetical protein BKK80_22225 [Cupriavidus malaysiensis]